MTCQNPANEKLRDFQWTCLEMHLEDERAYQHEGGWLQ